MVKIKHQMDSYRNKQGVRYNNFSDFYGQESSWGSHPDIASQGCVIELREKGYKAFREKIEDGYRVFKEAEK